MKKLLLIIALLLGLSPVSSMAEDGASLALRFQHEVDRRLDVPRQDQARYGNLLEAALAKSRGSDTVIPVSGDGGSQPIRAGYFRVLGGRAGIV